MAKTTVESVRPEILENVKRLISHEDRRKPEFSTAVDQVSSLLDDGGTVGRQAILAGTAVLCYRRYVGHDLPTDLRLKRTVGSAYVMRLLGKTSDAASAVRPPGCDHAELFLWKGKPLYFVFHPYGLSTESVCELPNFCKEHGLDFSISADSWYYPGWTLKVEICQASRHKEYANAVEALREANRPKREPGPARTYREL